MTYSFFLCHLLLIDREASKKKQPRQHRHMSLHLPRKSSEKVLDAAKKSRVRRESVSASGAPLGLNSPDGSGGVVADGTGRLSRRLQSHRHHHHNHRHHHHRSVNARHHARHQHNSLHPRHSPHRRGSGGSQSVSPQQRIARKGLLSPSTFSNVQGSSSLSSSSATAALPSGKTTLQFQSMGAFERHRIETKLSASSASSGNSVSSYESKIVSRAPNQMSREAKMGGRESKLGTSVKIENSSPGIYDKRASNMAHAHSTGPGSLSHTGEGVESTTHIDTVIGSRVLGGRRSHGRGISLTAVPAPSAAPSRITKVSPSDSRLHLHNIASSSHEKSAGGRGVSSRKLGKRIFQKSIQPLEDLAPASTATAHSRHNSGGSGHGSLDAMTSAVGPMPSAATNTASPHLGKLANLSGLSRSTVTTTETVALSASAPVVLDGHSSLNTTGAQNKANMHGPPTSLSKGISGAEGLSFPGSQAARVSRHPALVDSVFGKSMQQTHSQAQVHRRRNSLTGPKNIAPIQRSGARPLTSASNIAGVLSRSRTSSRDDGDILNSPPATVGGSKVRRSSFGSPNSGAPAGTPSVVVNADASKQCSLRRQLSKDGIRAHQVRFALMQSGFCCVGFAF